MKNTGQINHIVNSSNHILVIQADNPDGDSLASSLALEHIFGDMGKTVSMYCGVDIPVYLRYLDGWDRVSNELPTAFDASIIVDTSAITLLEQLDKTGRLKWLTTKPSIVLDHHSSASTIEFATVTYITDDVATGELIYCLSRDHKWPVSLAAKSMIATSIMADSMGLMTEGTSASSIRVVADLVESGVSLAKLEEARRSLQRKSAELTVYKGQLLQRIEYYSSGRIATITIPFEEIEKYSHAYNPSILVIDEMRYTEGTCIAIAFKTYPGGRVTAKIRANLGYNIAADLAEHFGGGGHPYASGFKVQDGRTLESIKSECIKISSDLLDQIEANKS